MKGKLARSISDHLHSKLYALIRGAATYTNKFSSEANLSADTEFIEMTIKNYTLVVFNYGVHKYEIE